MSVVAPPVPVSHILAVSPSIESHRSGSASASGTVSTDTNARPSSPDITSPVSESRQYASDRDYDSTTTSFSSGTEASKYNLSSPPSSVPSSAGSLSSLYSHQYPHYSHQHGHPHHGLSVAYSHEYVHEQREHHIPHPHASSSSPYAAAYNSSPMGPVSSPSVQTGSTRAYYGGEPYPHQHHPHYSSSPYQSPYPHQYPSSSHYHSHPAPPPPHYSQHHNVHPSYAQHHHYSHPQQHMLPFPGGHDDIFARPYLAPRAAMIPGLNMDRPGPKRRRTCPELMGSPTAARRRGSGYSYDRPPRGMGKENEDVWPEDVEIAFFESIRLVPRLGRKKITVGGKACGRNELIGDYIRRKTGKIRSRKQVSSHIQVLKNIRRDDEEFMSLVAEPKPADCEDDFTPEASALFFAPQEFAHVTAEGATPPTPASTTTNTAPAPAPASQPMFPENSLSASSATSSIKDGLLSPYCGGSFFSSHSSSGASSPAVSPACSNSRSVSPYPYPAGAAPGTHDGEDLPPPLQVFQLKLAPPSPAVSTPASPMEVAPTSSASATTPTSGSTAQDKTPVVPSGAVTARPPVVSTDAPSSISGQVQPTIVTTDANATPKSSPSKLGHRRAASRGLSLSIPPINLFTAPSNGDAASPPGQQNQSEQESSSTGENLGAVPGALRPADNGQLSSNPTTPWPQVVHTPTCPPPAPNMLGSPTQRHRLSAIWANSSADWNKASPALEGTFQHELSAAVASSKTMQDAAARTTVPMKRSLTDIPLSSNGQTSRVRYSSTPDGKTMHVRTAEDVPQKSGADEQFFSTLLGSREY